MGLNIAVDDAVSMCVFKGFADIESNLYRRIDRQMAVFFDILFQRLAAYKLHDDVMDIFIVADVVYIDDIGMGQFSSRLRFLPKTNDKIVVVAVFCMKHLDCDDTIQENILGLIYAGHAACAYFFQYLVSIV